MSGFARAAILALTLAIGGVASPLASADLYGSVVGSAAKGGPAFAAAGASITVTDATGDVLATAVADSKGAYVLTGIGLPGAPAPAPALTIAAAYTDPCQDDAHRGLTAVLRVAAGATGYLPVIRLDARRMCAVPASDFGPGAPPPTAYVDSADGRVIGPPGSIAYVRLTLGAPAAFSLWTKGFKDTGFTDDLVNLGASYDPRDGPPDELRITLPLAAGSEPLTLSYGSTGEDGATIGSVTVLNAFDPLTYHTTGTDIELAIDVSADMKTADPQGLRKDAVRSLLALVGSSDRLGALVFNDQAEQAFELQDVTSAGATALASLLDRRIADSGGTDDDAALAGAYDALSTPKVYDPDRAKTVILLTDGARHPGDDRNAHLLMRANPSGHPWPVCVVALGAKIAAADDARLQRIATETRGQYVPARTAADLGFAFRQCLATATGRQTLADSRVTFTKRASTRRISKKLAANTPVARWFTATAAQTELEPTLVDPAGGKHTPSALGKNVAFRKGKAFSLFTVLHPRAGTWTLVLSPKSRLATRAVARVTVTEGPAAHG